MFYDDWMNLGEDDGTFGTKADNHLKVSTWRGHFNTSFCTSITSCKTCAMYSIKCYINVFIIAYSCIFM